jgi:hypothetical protein
MQIRLLSHVEAYPTDLTDSQWSKIEKLFDARKRKHSLMEVVNAGDVDKSDAAICLNCLLFIPLRYFLEMSKKYVFFVAVKSRKKVVFSEANNVTNVMFAVVNFRQDIKFL